jgi:phospholipid-binding lipoprotein MlaA
MKHVRIALALVLLSLLGGCASMQSGASPHDPYEPINRKVFAFNEFVDTMFLKPGARAYVAITPAPVKAGIGNFFGNVGDGYSLVNSALQGKYDKVSGDLSRVFVNTIFGFGGLVDLGTALGYERGEEDFGQTLGHYGAKPGPFLMLPLFGPSNVRDAAGLLPNFAFDPVSKLVSSAPANNTLRVLRILDTRAALLPTEALLQSAALDKYTFLRSAYLQRRQNLVYDGKPPRDE